MSSTGAPTLGRPGLSLAGRFVLEVPIGRGAVGEVWSAADATLGTRVAVKLVAGAGGDAEAAARVVVEARAAAAIDSAHVVRILDQGAEAGIAWVAMELLEGESLADRLARQGRLSPVEVVRILSEVARGVSRAHARGVVHRDLKPANIFLAQVDGGEVAKVLDFGIAKVAGQAAVQTQQGIVVGTPAYMSREQVLGGQAVDHHADLWALAIIAYECLEGALPYLASSLSEVFVQIAAPRGLLRRPVASPSFAAWFERATAPSPEQRFGSAVELVEALALALGLPALLSRSSSLSALPPATGAAPGRTSPVLIATLAALAGLALVLVGVLVATVVGGASTPAHSTRSAEAPAPNGSARELAPPGSSSATGSSAPDPATAPAAGEPSPPSNSSAAAPSEPRASAAPSSSAAPSARPPPRPTPDRWGI